MLDEARAARTALAELSGRGRTTRIPDDVRALVLAYVRAARARRVGWSAIAAEMGLSRTVMQRWLRASPSSAGRRLRRVRVAAASSPRTVSLLAPSGHRIEGLCVEDAAKLLGLLT